MQMGDKDDVDGDARVVRDFDAQYAFGSQCLFLYSSFFSLRVWSWTADGIYFYFFCQRLEGVVGSVWGEGADGLRSSWLLGSRDFVDWGNFFGNLGFEEIGFR